MSFWVDILIVALLSFLWCWDYPPDHPAKKFAQKIGFPFLYLGLWHSWAMLAPDPSRKLANALFARSSKFEHSPMGTAGDTPALCCIVQKFGRSGPRLAAYCSMFSQLAGSWWRAGAAESSVLAGRRPAICWRCFGEFPRRGFTACWLGCNGRLRRPRS